jgi:hypothetical protein
MNLRLLVVTMVLLLGGLIALLALQWRLQKKLGVGAASPQEVTVPLGSRMLVGGGRAGIEFESRRDDRAKLIVRCAASTRWLALATGDVSEEVCGVRLKLTGFTSDTGTLATSRAHLVVSWGSGEAETEEPTR